MTLFSRITIIGVGMIGASLAWGVKRHRLTDCVVGIECDENHLETSLRLGLLDCGTSDLEKGIRHFGSLSNSPERPKPELIVLSTPVGVAPEMLQQIVQIARDHCRQRNILITDVGSTKQGICNRYMEIRQENDPCRFIGAHPIAGSERRGPESRIKHLFEDRLAVLTPTESVHDLDLALLIRFWQGLGSVVVSMEPDEHDRVLARTSHLPHLLSSLMAEQLHRRDIPYTGSGFRSTTRLAAGFPALWSDIVSSNAEAILDSIKDYEDALKNLRGFIERKEWENVTAFLETAKHKRDTLEIELPV